MSKCWKCGQEETTGHFNGNCAASYAQETELAAAFRAVIKKAVGGAA